MLPVLVLAFVVAGLIADCAVILLGGVPSKTGVVLGDILAVAIAMTYLLEVRKNK